MSAYSFHKSERLCSRKAVETLFARNADTHSVTAYPLRAVWREVGEEELASPGATVQVLIVVPKRRLRHAVDRNRAKRQVREAYRLNKRVLTARLHIAMLWIADTPVSSRRVHAAVAKILTGIGSALPSDTTA